MRRENDGEEMRREIPIGPGGRRYFKTVVSWRALLCVLAIASRVFLDNFDVVGQ